MGGLSDCQPALQKFVLKGGGRVKAPFQGVVAEMTVVSHR